MSLKDAFRIVHRLNIESTAKKGHESEKTTDMALNWLTEERLINSWWPANWDEDSKGIDRYVERIDGVQVLLQIKSSQYYADKFATRHPDIRCIIVRDDDKENIQDLGYRILGCITSHY